MNSHGLQKLYLCQCVGVAINQNNRKPCKSRRTNLLINTTTWWERNCCSMLKPCARRRILNLDKWKTPKLRIKLIKNEKDRRGTTLSTQSATFRLCDINISQTTGSCNVRHCVQKPQEDNTMLTITHGVTR